MNARNMVAAFAFAGLLSIAPALGVTTYAPGVTGAFIAAGGGAGSFSSVRAFSNMVGDTAVQTALREERDRFGSDRVDQFVEVFDFAIADGWKRAGQYDVSIPGDTSLTGRSLANSLLQLGTFNGKFDSGMLFNKLFTPKVSAAIATDAAKKYGNDAMISFYKIGDQFFSDLQPALNNG